MKTALLESMEEYVEKYNLSKVYASIENTVVRLDAYCCYGRKAGICSLEAEEKSDDSDVGYAGKWMYCRALRAFIMDSLRTKQYKALHGSLCGDSIRVAVFSCEHYQITGGQHRGCVYMRMGLPIPADEYYFVDKSHSKCPICEGDKDFEWANQLTVCGKEHWWRRFF